MNLAIKLKTISSMDEFNKGVGDIGDTDLFRYEFLGAFLKASWDAFKASSWGVLVYMDTTSEVGVGSSLFDATN